MQWCITQHISFITLQTNNLTHIFPSLISHTRRNSTWGNGESSGLPLREVQPRSQQRGITIRVIGCDKFSFSHEHSSAAGDSISTTTEATVPGDDRRHIITAHGRLCTRKRTQSQQTIPTTQPDHMEQRQQDWYSQSAISCNSGEVEVMKDDDPHCQFHLVQCVTTDDQPAPYTPTTSPTHPLSSRVTSNH